MRNLPELLPDLYAKMHFPDAPAFSQRWPGFLRFVPPLPFFAALAAVVNEVVHRVADPSDIDAATSVPRATPKVVEGYAMSGASDEEIARRLRLELNDLQQQFADVLSTTRALRAIALRKSQFDLAQKGNGPMLIWLGRNELGQSLNPMAPGEPEPVLEEKNG